MKVKNEGRLQDDEMRKLEAGILALNHGRSGGRNSAEVGEGRM